MDETHDQLIIMEFEGDNAVTLTPGAGALCVELKELQDKVSSLESHVRRLEESVGRLLGHG